LGLQFIDIIKWCQNIPIANYKLNVSDFLKMTGIEQGEIRKGGIS
jgi:hypothetical protein